MKALSRARTHSTSRARRALGGVGRDLKHQDRHAIPVLLRPRLYLSGLSKNAQQEIGRTRRLDLSGPVRLYEATNVLGESTHDARVHGEAWLAKMAANSSRPASA